MGGILERFINKRRFDAVILAGRLPDPTLMMSGIQQNSPEMNLCLYKIAEADECWKRSGTI